MAYKSLIKTPVCHTHLLLKFKAQCAHDMVQLSLQMVICFIVHVLQFGLDHTLTTGVIRYEVNADYLLNKCVYVTCILYYS